MKQHKNNKVKIIAPIWNDEFELPDSSFSVSETLYSMYLKSMKH